jgi:hypothetical protein
MRKNILLFLIIGFSVVVTAQPPQLIPYQAIARDNSGNPVLNQNIGLRFSIHDQTISGAVVWQESQTVVSNNLGIIVTALGGTTQLTSVDWGSGAKFLQVEMDIAGGTNYLDMGTQQMMSVPYALYAETAGVVANSGNNGGPVFISPIEIYNISGINQTINSNVVIDFDALLGQHVNTLILYYEHICPWGWATYATIRCNVQVLTNNMTHQLCSHFANTYNSEVDKIYIGNSGQIILPLSQDGIATFVNTIVNTDFNVKIIGYY